MLGEAMSLRISEITDTSGTTLRVDGRLLGSDVSELARAGAHAALPLALDLSGLQFADADGVDALRDLRARGARLDNIPPYVALLLEMAGTHDDSEAASAEPPDDAHHAHKPPL